jgi:hypothetical protein
MTSGCLFGWVSNGQLEKRPIPLNFFENAVSNGLTTMQKEISHENE